MSNFVHKNMKRSSAESPKVLMGLNLDLFFTHTNESDFLSKQVSYNQTSAANFHITESTTELPKNNALNLATSLAVTLLIPNETSYDYSMLGFGNFSNYSCDGEMQLGSLGNSTEFEEEESALSSTYFKTLVYMLYIPTFVFALLGNGIVCYIVQSTPRMRTVTNYFIANLAVGDILMSLFCVPFSFVSIFILMYWPFGIAFCYLVNYSQAVSVLVSAYTLVAISIDRYIAIMWPLRPRITKR